MPATFDNDSGDLLPDAQPRNRAQLGATPDTRSFGGSIWEFFHPGTVQDEYRAVGAQTVPSKSEIRAGAVDDAITATREEAAAVTDTAIPLLHWVVMGLIAYAVIEVAGKVPDAKRSVRGAIVKKYRRRAARAISKRIAG